jgi:AcrR family transcriptional regulator
MMFASVVEAGIRVLSQHGANGLTTNLVAEVAGVSVGSLYRYFPNKEAIVSAVFDRCLDRLGDVIGEAFDVASSVNDIVRGVPQRVVEEFTRERALYRELWKLRSAADAHGRIALHQTRMVERATAALLRLKLMPEAEARAFAYVMIHAADGVANAVAIDRDVDILQVAMVSSELLSRYFGSSSA